MTDTNGLTWSQSPQDLSRGDTGGRLITPAAASQMVHFSANPAPTLPTCEDGHSPRWEDSVVEDGGSRHLALEPGLQRERPPVSHICL